MDYENQVYAAIVICVIASVSWYYTAGLVHAVIEKLKQLSSDNRGKISLLERG